ALPEEFRKEVHQRWVRDVIANGFEALDRLRIPQGATEVQAKSAFELSDKERTELKAKLKEKLGFDTKLTEQIEPGVIAGLVVSIGSLVLDGSLKFAIQEQARAKSKQSG
ncbi:MAG: F0F1 ATP synthase subunit delta, partial [Candidatus Omnitrophica bacterium]|nr:F0F1 ATP synthase subunit delta [Candidatus Omnitrophota bacterium]